MDSDGLSLADRQSGSGNAWSLDIRSMSLQSLLARFESLPQVQISGPDWLSDQRYDLKAVVSDEYRLQLRSRPTRESANSPREVVLLALQEIRRRFQIQSHREKKEMVAYVLRPVDGVESLINRPGNGSRSRAEGGIGYSWMRAMADSEQRARPSAGSSSGFRTL
jgi:uncharacterized protein (TIGR03435 family)